MKLDPIITSLLSNDLYKVSMTSCVAAQFDGYTTKWRFKNRDWQNTGCYTPEMVQEIREQIDHFCTLRFTEDELDWLRRLTWIRPAYIDFLRLWHPRREEIVVEQTDEGCGMRITAEGSWKNTSFYEVPILAIVNEVQLRMREDYQYLARIAVEKSSEIVAEALEHPIGTFSEFGMRRRFSSALQDAMVEQLVTKKVPGFVGTSNMYLAKKYGVKPVGTMAHEFVMCVGQGTPGWDPAYSNKFMMQSWTDEFGVENGIALTDTIGLECFLLDFNKKFATLFSGVRHDSGDPWWWGRRMLEHYKKLGIDPKTKTLLFSDSLDFHRARALNEGFSPYANVAFGIGTFLANPSPCRPNVVMKVVECNGLPVCKLSDSDGKIMCESPEYIAYLKRAIQWRIEHGR